jgi:hypothetical protein
MTPGPQDANIIARNIGFLSSVIKSGEPFTAHCQESADGAAAALNQMLDELGRLRAVARFVADPESVERVARELALHSWPHAPVKERKVWAENHWEVCSETARVILNLIARAANAE